MRDTLHRVWPAVLALVLVLSAPVASWSISAGEGRGGAPEPHQGGDAYFHGSKMDMMMNGYDSIRKGADLMLSGDRQKTGEGHRMVVEGHKMVHDADKAGHLYREMVEGADTVKSGADMMMRQDDNSKTKGAQMVRSGLDLMNRASTAMRPGPMQ